MKLQQERTFNQHNPVLIVQITLSFGQISITLIHKEIKLMKLFTLYNVVIQKFLTLPQAINLVYFLDIDAPSEILQIIQLINTLSMKLI